jgi:hypothetical protein
MSLPLLGARWVEMLCGSCGIRFCVEEFWHQERRETGKEWHCPNGHSRVYCETEVGRLKRELAAKEVELARQRVRAERSERQLVAARGQVTKIKNRVGNGVCPCCRRSFQNLQRHMGNQHPDWKTQEVGG